MTDRWERLERYARWRSRLCIERLPGDVLFHVATLLDPRDVCSLCEALVCHPSPTLNTCLQSIPGELQSMWLHCHAWNTVKNALDHPTLRNVLLHHARSCTSVLVFLDWSPFAKASSVLPVAECRWLPQEPFVEVILYQENLQRSVRQSLQYERPCAQLSVYGWSQMHTGHSMIHYRPLHLSQVWLTHPVMLPTEMRGP